MKQIPLTQGKFAIVDDEDYEELSKYNWYAWRGNGTYYAVRSIGKYPNRSKERMHRRIMKAHKGQEVDHINRDSLDNRRCNLRLCTRSQNMANMSSYRKNCSSKYKGVSWDKIHRKWVAYICRGKQRRLGFFISEIDAAKAYDEAAIKLFGEYANKNFSRGQAIITARGRRGLLPLGFAAPFLRNQDDGLE